MESNGLNLIIPRIENEFDKSYYLRCEFILKQQPNNNNELNRAIKFSKMYANRELLGCEYSNSINNIINNML